MPHAVWAFMLVYAVALVWGISKSDGGEGGKDA